MTPTPTIYLDCNATMPLDPAALEAMLPFLARDFGNPSSSHAYGQAAHAAVELARRQLAALADCRADEVVFTGGGSEASNLAIKGVLFPLLFGGGRTAEPPQIVTSAIEHPATLQPCRFLERLGCRLVVLPVDRRGVVDLDALRQALRRPTTLVSLMHSNNEVGTLQPIWEAARLAHAAGALFHADAAQSLGKLPLSFRGLGVDMLTVAGHKLYAPKGVGALIVRGGVKLEPLVHGAGHERGLRAGTENVPHLVALGAAAAVAQARLPVETERLRALRDRLETKLRGRLGDRLALNGPPDERLPNTLNVSFLGHVGAELLAKVPRVAASTGSACHEGRVTLSPVLAAMGVPEAAGKGAVRLSVGRFTTEAEVDEAAELLAAAARQRPN